jgi:hypothetical protein
VEIRPLARQVGLLQLFRWNSAVIASIFLEFTLPNAATWFYFSLLLAFAVFFKFDRFLSIRNLDLVALYCLVPGILFLIQAHGMPITDPDSDSSDLVRTMSGRERLLLVGYIWLVAGSFLWFVRCLFDLGLDKRPSLNANLNLAGLACLGSAMLVCLGAAAVRHMPDAPDQIGRDPIAVTKFKEGASVVVGSSVDWEGKGRRSWGEISVAILLHVAVVGGLVAIGVVHFRDPIVGFGMAALYLMLPFTAYMVVQVHHVWPSAFIIWAVHYYKRPVLAGALLGIAAGSTFFPFLLFPLWFGFYRNCGSGRFTLGFLLMSSLSVGLTAMILAWSGELRSYLHVVMSLSDWQAWKAPTTESIWTGSHWAYRLPVFVAFIAFIGLTIFWPKPRNLAQVIAQSAAVIIGVQFWFADQGGVYVLWYLPLVLLMVFRPNLSEVRPPIPSNQPDWVSVQAKRAASWVRRARRSPKPASVA